MTQSVSLVSHCQTESKLVTTGLLAASVAESGGHLLAESAMSE